MPNLPEADEIKRWMKLAIDEARIALGEKEVPVGSVVVSDGRIIGRGHNRVEALKDPTAHAEMLALTAACQTVGDWRLNGAWLYTTLEPCPMCLGAAGLARVDGIIYGAPEPRFGACGSRADLTKIEGLTQGIQIHGGVEVEASQSLVQEFFQMLRRDARVVESGGLENR
ncbi:MAG: nucleoside deaminase [Candidatus Eisenbacteria bacterium]|uniref:tRNA-specific adenosine deaminase n=1 Tax=Eiseniibacteriota bacterium TaxID=2212470 RepID=A0A948RS91_UNCEI|nr:nucleoside deaminase [Candidatus Eisenbacteria bacterium]MBU2689661.1 nucleoside deaminase [Candidatus Eisenbacteria bacterium]